MPDAPIPVLIDTDIGDDVDDALALGLAGRSPELALVGVTTVHGATVVRAQMARKVLDAFGAAGVPVVPGSGTTLAGTTPETPLNQQGVLTDADRAVTLPDTSAEQFIVEAAQARPGQVVVATIGALTNLARAIELEPALPMLLRGVQIMGGMASAERSEYNIACDPEAARRVFECGTPITMIGLDVTLQCRLTEAHVADFKASADPGTHLLGEMIGLWEKGTHRPPILHDPLDVATIFKPDLVRCESGTIRVETAGGPERARTHFEREGKRAVDVALGVDADAMIELFVSRVGGSGQ